jgi:hypothetical protein
LHRTIAALKFRTDSTVVDAASQAGDVVNISLSLSNTQFSTIYQWTTSSQGADLEISLHVSAGGLSLSPNFSEMHLRALDLASEMHLRALDLASEMHLRALDLASEMHLRALDLASEMHLRALDLASEMHLRALDLASEMHLRALDLASEMHLRALDLVSEMHLRAASLFHLHSWINLQCVEIVSSFQKGNLMAALSLLELKQSQPRCTPQSDPLLLRYAQPIVPPVAPSLILMDLI